MASNRLETRRLARWRWRMRGAWLWPCFAVFVAGDTVLLAELPPSGVGGDGFGSVLLAGFLNIGVVAVLAPLAGRLLRHRRADLPLVVASNYTGTALIVALALVLTALGLMHRPSVLASERSFRAQSDAVRTYVLMHGDAAERRHLSRADSLRLDANLYRTCVPGAAPSRELCLFVDTTQSPPGLRLDPNPVPNTLYFGARK